MKCRAWKKKNIFLYFFILTAAVLITLTHFSRILSKIKCYFQELEVFSDLTVIQKKGSENHFKNIHNVKKVAFTRCCIGIENTIVNPIAKIISVK